jgi:hypothetical protein
MLLLSAELASCGREDNPVEPSNHYPVMSSLAVFPTAIGPTDSAIIVCNAMDPDGDTLVYDWITDARLRIKGAPAGVYHFNTFENSQVLYMGSPLLPIDTAYIECTTRDRRGGAAQRTAILILTQ